MEEATLLVVTNTKNENGYPVQTTEEIPVYVRKKSAVRTEYYEALRSGFTVKMVFEVRQEDFKKSQHTENGKKVYATKIIYDGSTYDIIRTYEPDKAMIELICA